MRNKRPSSAAVRGVTLSAAQSCMELSQSRCNQMLCFRQGLLLLFQIWITNNLCRSCCHSNHHNGMVCAQAIQVIAPHTATFVLTPPLHPYLACWMIVLKVLIYVALCLNGHGTAWALVADWVGEKGGRVLRGGRGPIYTPQISCCYEGEFCIHLPACVKPGNCHSPTHICEICWHKGSLYGAAVNHVIFLLNILSIMEKAA